MAHTQEIKMGYTYSIKTQYTVSVENDTGSAAFKVEQYDNIEQATTEDPKLLVEYVRALARKHRQTALDSVSIKRIQNFSVTKYNEDDSDDAFTTDYALWFNQAQKRSKTREVVLSNLTTHIFDKWFEEVKQGESAPTSFGDLLI